MTKDDWIKEQKYDADFMFRLAVVGKRNTGYMYEKEDEEES